MPYTEYLRPAAAATAVWYKHGSPVASTFTAGTLCTFTEEASTNNGAGNISLDAATDTVTLAADTGKYEVMMVGDVEAPAAGDSTTLSVLVSGGIYGFANVTETGQQTATWCDIVDTAGAAQTIEVDRFSVTGSGRLDVKLKITALG